MIGEEGPDRLCVHWVYALDPGCPGSGFTLTGRRAADPDGPDDLFRVQADPRPGEGYVLTHRVAGVPSPLRASGLSACLELARSVLAVADAR